MKRAFLVVLIAMIGFLLLAVFSACDDTAPVIAGTPTPTASPTPKPEPFTYSVTGAPPPVDLLGKTIDGEDHFMQYLSFGALRIYEYENGTFLDGVCVNGYPAALDGKIHIVFYDSENRLCGMGTIHNALGTTVLESGTNNIYAEISADVDVQNMPLVQEIVVYYHPIEADAG